MKQVAGIWLPDDDTHFAKHLERGPQFEGAGTYQFSKIEAVLGFIPKKQRQCAFDIGAHVGLWTRVLARHFKNVEAFEPVPELLECFDANTAHLNNVKIWPCAISENEGCVRLSQPDGNSGNWHASAGGETVKYEVLAMTLNDLSERFALVNFVKIDVEGWELPIIRGGREMLTAHRPFVLVEQKPGNAERYGFARYGAAELLEELGAKRLWERSGDILYGWN